MTFKYNNICQKGERESCKERRELVFPLTKIARKNLFFEYMHEQVGPALFSHLQVVDEQNQLHCQRRSQIA